MRKCLGVAGAVLLMASAIVAQPLSPVDTSMSPGSYRYFDRPINPDLYLMRPGDELRVTFIDAQLSPLLLTLDPEVRIVDRTLGILDLAGETLTQASQQLRETLSKYYHVDQIAIAVVAPRKVGIQVSGAVNKPGLYVVYTSQRVSEVVDSAGGIREDGSHRFILLRGGPHDLTVDLDRALYLGEDSSNPPLYAGYSVYVPPRGDRVVDIVGEVNTPREVELADGDSLSLLLRLAGGLRSLANPDSIRILRGTQELVASKVAPEPGDIIVVPPRPERSLEEGLILYGAVNKPGRYAYKEGTTLKQLLDQAGGFVKDAAPDGTTIFRRAVGYDNTLNLQARYPIGNLLSDDGKIAEVVLRPTDSVFVPAAIGLVEVTGEVRNPGTYPFTANQPVSYYISMAGGMLPTAEKSRIDIFKRVSKITSVYSTASVVHDGDHVIVLRREELQ